MLASVFDRVILAVIGIFIFDVGFFGAVLLLLPFVGAILVGVVE